VNIVATANWYGYTGTPPPPLDVLDVVLDRAEEVGADEEEDDALELDGMEEEEVELDEDTADVLLVDEEAVATEEAEYSRTLPAAQSEIQRLPFESNARP
jgi:hypothetical protein